MHPQQRPISLRAAAAASPAPPPLPAPPTPLIGRDADLAALLALPWGDAARLVTLTGPGGVGKTRLALALAEALAPRFAAGAAFVDLSGVGHPDLVPAAVALALGVRAAPQQGLLAAIAGWLAERHLLLLLDNCEQIAEAAPIFARWLASCPGLAILATSRSSLQLRWEQEYPVAPLPLPAPQAEATPGGLADNPAVALFVAHARSARPAFALTPENAAVVAALCRRLDGLPLAIELAAPFVRFLPPATLLEQIEAQRALPPTGLRDLPERQRSLDLAVAWSEHLLTPASRRLFHRLAAAPGSFDLGLATWLDAALDPEGGPDRAQARLHELVAHQLLRLESEGEGGPRYAMLQTIRDCAAARLAADGEAEAADRALAAWALDLAERAAPALIGPDQRHWLARLDREAPTIGAVLHGAIGRGDAATALRLSAALWWGWYMRGRCVEGRAALAAALALPGDEAAPARARALIGAGALAYLQGDAAAAERDGAAGLALARALGDRTAVALGLNLLGNVALWRGDHALARRHYEAQIGDQRRDAALGPLAPPDRFGLALSLTNLGVVWQAAGDDRRAAECQAEALALLRPLGDRQGIAHATLRLGESHLRLGRATEADALAGEALALFRALDDRWGIARALLVRGRVHLGRDAPGMALPALREALALFDEAGIRLGVVECCEALAQHLAARGGGVDAARLLAAVAAARAALGAARSAREAAEHDALVARLRRSLSARDFAAAWASGGALTFEQAVARARAAAAPAAPPAAPVPALTRRERQVVALVARGLTNRQIAEHLGNSERTIETHIQHVAGKLGLTRRTRIATWANANGLAGDEAAGRP